ncbi:MAG: NAD-dependent epimerase/dehydratase family protein, partial [Nitrospira sp.]|nr:NAD-dependent epimerase/dehydratase family protein [Nitrospira sp.]
MIPVYTRTMKKAFVTGASGFIGSAVARALLRDGVEVRALVRPSASRKAIDGLDVEVVPGGLDDHSAIAEGLKGCDACFHVAGMNRLSLRGRAEVAAMHEANDKGAARVLRIAAESGCEAIVHTSTIAVIGRPPKGVDRHANESDHPDEDELVVPYQLSKHRGELRALKLAEEGAPVVIVSPTAPMGPFDVKPTPTGKMVLDFLR